MRKLLALLLSTLLVVSLLAGCGSTKPADTTTPDTPSDSTATPDTGNTDTNDGKVYKIACDAAFAPFSIQLEEGTTAPGTVVTTANGLGDYYGIDVEILDAIAQNQGFEYELAPMDFSGIIPALASGTIDGGIAGMSITEERAKTVDFSDAYYDSGYALVVNKDNADITTFEGLNGKVAACKEGTMGMNWCQENADKYGFTVSVYPDSASMMLAVSNKQADFLIEDYPVISYQIAIGQQASLKVAIDTVDTPAQYGFAVKKGENAELLTMFNAGLAAIRADGTYDAILNSYK